jgi:hypothetical protein
VVEGNDTSPPLSLVNRALGPALRAEGAAIGVEAAGMTGVKGTGDVGVLGDGIVGVRGHASTGPGVEGQGEAGVGVHGESQAGYGVSGRGHFDDGVHGETSHGFSAGVSGSGPTGVVGRGAVVGVSGYSEAEAATGLLGSVSGNDAKAVVGQATGYGAVAVEGTAQFGTGVVASGEVGMRVTGTTGQGLIAEGATGIQARGVAQDGLSATSDGPITAAAVRGAASDEAFGGYFTSGAGTGLAAYGSEGIHAESTGAMGGVGVHGVGATGVAGNGTQVGVSGSGTLAGVSGNAAGGGHGVTARSDGTWLNGAALFAENSEPTYGMAAYLKNTSTYHTAHVQNAGSGGVLYLQNNGDANGAGGGDLITAVGAAAEGQFRVTSSGQARSDVGFATPAEDFAEYVPALPGLAPGDVLAIGPDGRLVRSEGRFQATVAGVYSTAPGFLGGQPLDGAPAGEVPLAIVGVVPVRASAENGAIRPGDLLVAAGTAGHAMRGGASPPIGSVLGKALEPLDGGTGLIRMLAGLR